MKIIGIVGRMYYNKDNQEIVQLNDYLRRIFSDYENVVTVVLLPTNKKSYFDIGMGNDSIELCDIKKLDYLLDKCDGFVIPGGSSWYNFDEYVIRYALNNDRPVLGICAGFQAMCSMFASDRSKFDMTSRLSDDKHYNKTNEYIHEVVIKDNTLLSKIFNKKIIWVNSIHHDYVNFPMKELIISAVSNDNIIEAVEIKNHKFFVGLQWHPEYLLDNYSKKLFDYFIDSINKS